MDSLHATSGTFQAKTGETAQPLTFAALRAANVARCEGAFHGIDRWTPIEWMNAIHGECGEAANLLKKLLRLQTAPATHRPEDGDAAHIEAAVAEELADVAIYLDLLATRMGIDLGAAVVAKFNRVSERVGAPQRLPAQPDDPLAGLPVAVPEQAGEFLRLLIEACPEMAVNGVSAFHDHYAFAPSLVLLLARAMPGAARTHGPPVVEATEMLTRLIGQRDELLKAAKEAKGELAYAGDPGRVSEAFNVLDAAIRAAEGD